MRQLLLACLFAVTGFAHAEVIDIDNAQLEKLNKSGVPVIDIRLQSEWEETGIVSGSRLLTFFDEKGRADPVGWLEKVKPIAKPNEPVIVICRSGNRTKAVSQFLSQQAGYGKVYNVRQFLSQQGGYTTVYNVKSGIKGWIGAGGAVVPATPTIASCKATKTC